MRTSHPKVAHTILGKPLLLWALESVLCSGVRDIVVVISPNQPQVEEILSQYTMPPGCALKVCFQAHPRGTADATAAGMGAAEELLAQRGCELEKSQIIVGFGDTPAVSAMTFDAYLNCHLAGGADFTVLAFQADDPTGYGRILCDEQGGFLEIREERDCNHQERSVRLCNSGFLCGKLEKFRQLLPQVSTRNAAGEFYLTDVPALARQLDGKISIFSHGQQSDLEGVNTQIQLARIAKILQGRIVSHWMDQGIQFLNPEAVYVEDGIEFEPGVVVEPFVYLAGRGRIPSGTRVIAGTRLCL